MIQDEMEGLTLVIGVLVGASTALLLLTIISCVCCSWCPNYNKKDMEKFKGSMYRLPHPVSPDSRVTATYSVSNGASGSRTPLDPSLTGHGQDTSGQYQQEGPLYRQGISHSHTLPHSLYHHHSFRIRDEGAVMHKSDRKYGTLGRQPREQPPAYHILPRSSYLLIPQDTPDLLSETKIQADTALASLSQSMAKVNMMKLDKEEEEEDIYQSTKF